MRMSDGWRTVYRVVVGIYWLYFGSQKWQGVGWMRPLIEESARVNPIPGLHELLTTVVAPHWLFFAVAQGVGETLVAICLILGLATRKAAILGFLLALNLALTVAFLVPDIGIRWLYYLALLINAELVFADTGALSLGRSRFVPAWLRA